MAMETSDIITLATSAVAVIVSGASMLVKRTTVDVKTKATLDAHATRLDSVERTVVEMRQGIESGFNRIFDKVDTLSSEMHKNNSDVLGKLIDHMSQSSK